MPDREKVIKGLEHCSEDGCKECPYETDCIMADGFSELAKDVLELLKEQEPVKPKRDNTGILCGWCGQWIGANDRFCSNCGIEVKWDD